MPSRRTTIRDVAKAAGVSTTTVSDALAGRGRIADETRQRVQVAADAIGYVASATARNLRIGRAGSIGLYVPHHTVGFEYYAHLSQGAAETAMSHGFALTLVPAWDSPAQLRALHLDGVIVSDPAVDDPVVETLRSMPVPMVTCERDLSPGVAVAAVVQSDHVTATHQLIDHLVNTGAEQIAVLAPGSETAFGQDIRLGCSTSRVEVMVHDIPLAFGRDDIERVTDALTRTRPDAIVAVPDGAAVHVLHLLQEAGLRVPDDLLLASYVDGPLLQVCSPAITGVDINPWLCGRLAAETLVRAVQHPRRCPEAITVPAELKVRASTQRGERSS